MNMLTADHQTALRALLDETRLFDRANDVYLAAALARKDWLLVREALRQVLESQHARITWDEQGRRTVNGELAPEHLVSTPTVDDTTQVPRPNVCPTCGGASAYTVCSNVWHLQFSTPPPTQEPR